MLRLPQLWGSSSGKPVQRVELGPELRRHNALSLVLSLSPCHLLSHSSKSSPYYYLVSMIARLPARLSHLSMQFFLEAKSS